MDINAFLQFIAVLITLISVIILSKTIKSNQDLNKNNLFNELVKQERELKIKLSEYREEIHKRISKGRKSGNWKEITLDYDTLLFNYYEYLAVCIHQKLINEKIILKYFKPLVIFVRERFEASILFKEGFAKKEEYPGILWLFKKWDIK